MSEKNHITPLSLKYHFNILFLVLSGYPGFITKFRGTDKVPDKPDTDTVDFENYRHVCHKWHYKEKSPYSRKIEVFFIDSLGCSVSDPYWSQYGSGYESSI